MLFIVHCLIFVVHLFIGMVLVWYRQISGVTFRCSCDGRVWPAGGCWEAWLGGWRALGWVVWTGRDLCGCGAGKAGCALKWPQQQPVLNKKSSILCNFVRNNFQNIFEKRAASTIDNSVSLKLFITRGSQAIITGDGNIGVVLVIKQFIGTMGCGFLLQF